MSTHNPARVDARNRKKQIEGIVVSDTVDQTIVVKVNRRARHPLYKKYIVISKKFMAHDPHNRAHRGDIVRLIESRPISKRKRWRLIEVVKPLNGGI